MKAIVILFCLTIFAFSAFCQEDNRRTARVYVTGCDSDVAMERLLTDNVNNIYGRAVVIVPKGYKYEVSFEVECKKLTRSQTIVDEQQQAKNRQLRNTANKVDNGIQRLGNNIRFKSSSLETIKDYGFDALGNYAANRIESKQKQERYNFKYFETVVTFKLIYRNKDKLPTFRANPPLSILVEDIGKNSDGSPLYIVQEDIIIVPQRKFPRGQIVEEKLIKGSPVNIGVLQMEILNWIMLDQTTTTVGK